MTDAGRWQAFKTDVSRFGFFEALLGHILKLIKPWFTAFRISTRPLGIEIDDPPNIDCHSRILNHEEMRTLPEIFPKQIDSDFVEAAILRGDICSSAFVEDQIVGMNWRSYSTAPHEDGLWVRFKPPYRYGYKAFVKPEFRGQRVLQGRTTDSYCASQGATNTISFIERQNLSSLQGNKRRGVQRFVGYIFMFNIFGKRFMYRTPGVRAIGFEFYEPAREQTR